MDAFYASVEAERRDIEDEPIVVCVYSGRTEDSGAVSTCSYDARELGIHAAMPIKEAKRIAEQSTRDVHFVGMDKEYYDSFSDDIREQVLSKHADKIEKASIDEFYLQTEVDEFEETLKAAENMQRKVRDDFGVTCSVGIAPNKLVAKIASDRDKPEGITAVTEEKMGEFMKDLDIGDIHGIGDKTVEKLNDLGISSVEELAEADPSLLVREFGEKQGLGLRKKARGEDDSEVEESIQKQITRITTLDQNSSSYNHIRKIFPQLASDLVEKTEELNVNFQSVVIIAIDTDLQMHTRATSMKTPVNDKDIILEKGEELLHEFLEENDLIIRRVGLRVKNLKQRKGQKSFTDFT